MRVAKGAFILRGTGGERVSIHSVDEGELSQAHRVVMISSGGSAGCGGHDARHVYVIVQIQLPEG